ncbi:MAG: hypothetical protein PHI40_06840 [Caldisericia bacterium]|nr:hypothetical protein [Caldisericia bacterium]MDD4615101.1 hypothetical protein [Caldisericia bacterium]
MSGKRIFHARYPYNEEVNNMNISTILSILYIASSFLLVLFLSIAFLYWIYSVFIYKKSFILAQSDVFKAVCAILFVWFLHLLSNFLHELYPISILTTLLSAIFIGLFLSLFFIFIRNKKGYVVYGANDTVVTHLCNILTEMSIEYKEYGDREIVLVNVDNRILIKKCCGNAELCLVDKKDLQTFHTVMNHLKTPLKQETIKVPYGFMIFYLMGLPLLVFLVLHSMLNVLTTI